MVKNPQNGHVRKILVQSASHRPVRKIDTALFLYSVHSLNYIYPNFLLPNFVVRPSEALTSKFCGLSRRSWSPATTGPPGPSAANYVAVDDPPGPSMAAMDGPLCRKWSPSSKPEK